MTPSALAQKILDGPWMHASAAVRACQQNTWGDFARLSAPPKPLLFGRFAHARCVALAERPPAAPVTKKVTVVPLWACTTEDAVSTDWVAVHGLAQEGQALYVHETGPYFASDASPRADALLECTVRQWTGAIVVEAGYYAQDVPMRLRAGGYGVLDRQVLEVVAVDLGETATVPRPAREVPMFARWFVPRVRVPAELESQIRAMCFTTKDDGEGEWWRAFE